MSKRDRAWCVGMIVGNVMSVLLGRSTEDGRRGRTDRGGVCEVGMEERRRVMASKQGDREGCDKYESRKAREGVRMVRDKERMKKKKTKTERKRKKGGVEKESRGRGRESRREDIESWPSKQKETAGA